MSQSVVSNIQPRGMPGHAQLISATLVWATQTDYVFDFSFIGQQGIFKNPKTLFVDNSENPSEITVLVERTGQTFPVPAYKIGYFPLALAEDTRVILSSDGGTGVTVNVQFYNYVVAPFTWEGPTAPQASAIAIGADATGVAPTKAPVYVAGIDTVGGQIKPFLLDETTGELLVKASISGGATETTLAAILADLTEGATATKTNVASSAASVTLLAAGSTRKSVMIYNDSASELYLSFGNTAASVTSFSVKIGPGVLYEVPDKYRTLEMRGIWSSADGNARITSTV